MGNTYEVGGWAHTEERGWHYAEIYRGESVLAALWNLYRARRAYGCVRLEVRL